MSEQEKEDEFQSSDEILNEPTAQEKAVTLKESEYQKLLKDAADFKDRYLRLLAEFENARKRNERERQEFLKYAKEDVMADFLNVLDDLERSVHAAKINHQDYAGFLKGIELVMSNVSDMLKRHNVKPMQTVGKKFDPHCHEVLMQEDAEGKEEGTILEEFQKGYFLGDKVVRTAKVKVAKSSTENSENKTDKKLE